MLAKLLVVIAIALIMGIILAVCIWIDKRSQKQPREPAIPQLAPFNRDDVAFLYAAGMSTEDIKMAAEQRRMLE